MKSKTAFPLLTLFLWLAAMLAPAPAATYTDGSTSFTVTFNDPSGNYSARVDAFWITDSTGAFVQNIRKDAATRQQYLYQWAAARKTTTIDGYSGRHHFNLDPRHRHLGLPRHQRDGGAGRLVQTLC